jgi:predicted nuclease of predicted toxin-antitoxin system
MASFYADEHVPFPLVDALRLLGHDVLTARDDGRANQRIGDPDVLDRATALGRAVLTNNRGHFHRLHQRRPNHAGIVTFTNDDIQPLAHRIDAAVAPLPTLAGLLVRVTRPNPSQRGPATQPP